MHRWRRFCIWSFVVAVSAFWARPTLGSFIEDFRTGNDDWLTTTINNGGVEWTSSAGYVSLIAGQKGAVTDSVGANGHRLFGFQPASTAIFGSMTGMAMTTDFMMTGSVTGPQTPMVRFYVGDFSGGRSDYFVSSDAFSWDPNTSSSWSTHIVPLVAGNFIEWPNSAAHSRTFAQVIAAPEDIGLVFTGASNLFSDNHALGFTSDGGTTIGLTMFGTVPLVLGVPEPGTWMALGLGSLALLPNRQHRWRLLNSFEARP